MKKKYIFCLIVIGIMLTLTLTIGTGYGVYVSTKDEDSKKSITMNCFKIYYPDTDIIEMKNINPVVNEEGLETSPYTLTITNICEQTKELQVRLNILSDSTIDTKSLTLQATGNIQQDVILYKNLKNSKTKDKNVLQSKLVGLAKVEPNETVRTNIKIWFDEKKAPTIAKDAFLKAQFELIDSDSAIKSTFVETILSNKENIENKPSPIFTQASTTEEGIYKIANAEGNSYYYRGVVNNNYVSFAGLNWRILRVNPDNTVRLILDKSSAYMSYNDLGNIPEYVGLNYTINGISENNKVYNYLMQWYNNTIVAKDLDKYVAVSTFCNDTSNYINNYHIYYNGYARLITGKTPDLICPDTNASYGGTYKQKVGLISADEVALAGGLYNTNNLSYFLYSGESFYTLTGSEYFNNIASMFIVNSNGMLTSSNINQVYGIRPVISLNADVTVSGAGTLSNPYTINMN